MSQTRIVLKSVSYLAGGSLEGRVMLDGLASRHLKYLELNLACFFGGGVMVSPTMHVKRIVPSTTPSSERVIIDFEYAIPRDVPSSNPKFVDGQDLGVKYVLTVKLVRGMFHKNVSLSAPVVVTRRDSGTGLRVKFVKFGGPSFNDVVETIHRNYPNSKPAESSDNLAPAVSCC